MPIKVKKKNDISSEYLVSFMKNLESPEGYLYASEKKFHRLFGRDSIITSLQLLPWFPQISRNTILALAKYQNKNGQIIHETEKIDTMWDSLDSTPLFIVLVGEYLRKTKDLLFIEEFLPAIEKAYSWINIYGDNDNDYFLEYYKNSSGLTHHCWKDSADGMTDKKNKLPVYPIAPIEIQAYYYKALTSLSFLYKKIGDQKKSENFTKKAIFIKKKFNDSFWIEEEKFFALCLDGDKKPIKIISSNVGHALWSGVIDKNKIKYVVDRITKNDILTEYGLRTLSEKMPNYDPLTYHRGSIWPFDNWFLAEGLEKYKYLNEANTVRKNVLKSLEKLGDPFECYTFDNNELGTEMRTWDNKTIYPEKIQSWTLGAMYSFLMKLNSDTLSQR